MIGILPATVLFCALGSLAGDVAVTLLATRVERRALAEASGAADPDGVDRGEAAAGLAPQ